MAGDRVSEAYLGEIDERAVQKNKDRIDWFVEMCTGDVLDIGCSQGITAVLAGRNGANVLALDNDKESLDYARNLLANEEDSVQDNVIFDQCDFLEYNLRGKMFDTILLGEILEHLFNPSLFLTKALKHLKTDGTVIISVPFGINPFWDHKRTYYFSDIKKQVSEFFDVVEVKFFTRTIALVAKHKDANHESVVIDEFLIARIENAFFDLDTDHHSFMDLYKLKVREANAEITKLKASNQDFSTKVKTLTETNNTLTDSNNSYSKNQLILDTENKSLTKNNALLQADFKLLNSDIVDLNIEKALLERKNKELCLDVEAKSEIISDELETLKIENEKLKRDLSTSQTRLNQITKKCNTVDKAYKNLSNSKLGKLQRGFWKIKSKKKPKNKRNTNSTQTLSLNSAENKLIAKKFVDTSDKDFYSSISKTLDLIPQSNGSKYFESFDAKIGIICDEFLLNSINCSAKFTFITPSNWETELEKQDVLMVVSAWNGLSGEWSGIANEGTIKRNLVYEIIEKAKELGIKTTYYSKEDPPHYEQYLEIAKRCEYIFTTCAEVVENYKIDCQNDNVSILSFGINPLYHNPIGCINEHKQDGIVFAGAWMVKFADRCKNLESYFDIISNSNIPLKVFDRNYNTTKSGNLTYLFPERFWRYISPSVSHNDLQKIHKLYNYAININSVTDSTTMFANRGYELQACGNILLTNYSIGMNDKLPNIFNIIDPYEIPLILNAHNAEQIIEKQMSGVRFVMTHETAFDRIAHFLNTIGIDASVTSRKVLVLADEITDKIQKSFDRQSLENKTLLKSSDLTEQLKFEYDIIAFFDENIEYNTYYLEDMVNGFKYTNCDYITKDRYYVDGVLLDGVEHNYVSSFKNKNCTVFWAKSFSAYSLINFSDNENITNGYAIDRLNVNDVPYTIENYDPKVTVIVPIYNNGKYLYAKAFSSLFRSKLFNEMEVILVDDGSTDQNTLKLIDYLANKHQNVTSYYFNDGGSGTAARPRNKGVELSTTDYILYMDPDDDLINDGYNKLFAKAITTNADLVVADTRYLDRKILNANYINKIEKLYPSKKIVDDSKNLLLDTDFITLNIQCMLIKKSIITSNNLSQVVGAGGEDTLFGWTLLLNSKHIECINEQIYAYYKCISGSVTNILDIRFFEKYKLVENPRRALLEKHDILEPYMQQRFSLYTKNWTLKNLSKIDKTASLDATKIVFNDIYMVYDDVYKNDDELINIFVSLCKANDFEKAFNTVFEYFN